jgi:colicin import membrane protein
MTGLKKRRQVQREAEEHELDMMRRKLSLERERQQQIEQVRQALKQQRQQLEQQRLATEADVKRLEQQRLELEKAKRAGGGAAAAPAMGRPMKVAHSNLWAKSWSRALKEKKAGYFCETVTKSRRIYRSIV